MGCKSPISRMLCMSERTVASTTALRPSPTIIRSSEYITMSADHLRECVGQFPRHLAVASVALLGEEVPRLNHQCRPHDVVHPALAVRIQFMYSPQHVYDG